MKRLTPIALALILVTACGDGGGALPGQAGSTSASEPAPSTTALADDVTTTVPPVHAPSLSEVDQALVDAAIGDLAERQSADVDDIVVEEFERVVWSDGSLGCPEPGMMYTQALVDGWRLVLGLAGSSFSYHAGGDDIPFLCDKPVLTDSGAER